MTTWYASNLGQTTADADGRPRPVPLPQVANGHVLIEARSHELFGKRVSYNELGQRVFIAEPFLTWPTDCREVSSPFGYRVLHGERRFHSGLDFPVPVGTEVKAVLPGKVHLVGLDPAGFGMYLVVEHPNGLYSLYAHLSEVKVRLGASVQAGQVIALSGASGPMMGPRGITGAHLHLALYATSARFPLFSGSVYDQEAAVDPRPFLKEA